MTSKSETRSFGPLLDALRRNRRVLLAAYVVLMGTCLYASLRLGFSVPEWFHALKGDADSGLTSSPDAADVFMVLAVFLLVHIAFLWGGGRVSLGREPAGVWRLIVPVALAGLLLAVICWTTVYSVLEMFDRVQGEGTLRDEAFGLDLHPLSNPLSLWLIAATWGIWFALGIYLFRARSQYGALGRLLVVLMAGSWLEFLVALPVDIVLRQRASTCPCVTGSWIALLVAVPVCLFAFGPGLLFLYLRELRLTQREPGRALRILVRKSRYVEPDG